MSVPHRCPICNGTGEVLAMPNVSIETTVCPTCEGARVLWSPDEAPACDAALDSVSGALTAAESRVSVLEAALRPFALIWERSDKTAPMEDTTFTCGPRMFRTAAAAMEQYP